MAARNGALGSSNDVATRAFSRGRAETAHAAITKRETMIIAL